MASRNVHPAEDRKSSAESLNIAPSKGEIILYQTADGSTSIDVKLENETVWLSSDQMAALFERDRTVIQRHVRNIYNEGELTRDITCAKFAHMGIDADQTYVTELFNLESSSPLAIASSQSAAPNSASGRMGYFDSPADDQIRSIFDVVKDYTYALDTLDSYDYQNLGIRSTSKEYFHATYENVMEVIRSLKAKIGGSDLFGHVHSGPRSKTGKDIPRLSMLFPTQYDVGVDNNGFRPVSFNELKTIIQQQLSYGRQ